MNEIEIRDVWEGADVTHSARVWDVDGTDLETGDFGGSDDVDVFVYTESGVLAYTSTTNAISGFLSNTLSTAGRWGNKDSKGYNFTNTLTQTSVATGPLSESMQGGRVYRTVYVLKTTSKGNVPLVFHDRIRPVKPA